MDIQQSQKEFENMARLQRERVQINQINNPSNIYSIDNNIDSDDLEEAKINIPSKPSFPLFVFSLAILKDVLDFAELTIIGIILSWAITIIFAVIAWFWCRGKAGFIKKMVIKRLAVMVAIGLVPVFGLIPEASVFIIWVHSREIKYIGDILQALERLDE